MRKYVNEYKCVSQGLENSHGQWGPRSNHSSPFVAKAILDAVGLGRRPQRAANIRKVPENYTRCWPNSCRWNFGRRNSSEAVGVCPNHEVTNHLAHLWYLFVIVLPSIHLKSLNRLCAFSPLSVIFSKSSFLINLSINVFLVSVTLNTFLFRTSSTRFILRVHR